MIIEVHHVEKVIAFLHLRQYRVEDVISFLHRNPTYGTFVLHDEFNAERFATYWNVEDFLGCSTQAVVPTVQNALKRIEQDATNPATPEEILVGRRIFARHLERMLRVFLETAIDCIILVSNPSPQIQCVIKERLERIFPIPFNHTVVPKHKSYPCFGVYQHPFKGSFEVNTFADVSEVITLELIGNDTVPKRWLELAKRLLPVVQSKENLCAARFWLNQKD